MKKIKKYNIYTDASFDEKCSIATYSIVIMLENKILKSYSKKSRIEIKNSTEIEIFAVYQAMNLILSCFIKKNEKQIFCINTDCTQVPIFFENNKKMKIFKHNESIKIDMIKTYNVICTKLNKNNCNFILKYISRDLNKIAHKQTYNMLKRIKKIGRANTSKEDILINKDAFCEILSSFNQKQLSIIIYLLNISNKNGIIETTQNEISNNINMPITTINRTIKKLNKLKILEKIKNGKYLLSI